MLEGVLLLSYEMNSVHTKAKQQRQQQRSEVGTGLFRCHTAILLSNLNKSPQLTPLIAPPPHPHTHNTHTHTRKYHHPQRRTKLKEELGLPDNWGVSDSEGEGE